jgi:hypothetical protein
MALGWPATGSVGWADRPSRRGSGGFRLALDRPTLDRGGKEKPPASALTRRAFSQPQDRPHKTNKSLP